jgi:EmrB/QacA subfamily drug resistance transporter
MRAETPDRTDMTDRRASGETSVPVPFCAPGDRPRLLWAAILASSMGFIDGSVTAIALTAIRAALGASLVQAQWVTAAYLVTLSGLVLAGGALGDRFGTARVFAIGIGVFVLASLGCAMAQDAGQMIGARALKGAGAALMVPGSMALVARAYPREERGRALGLWAAASTLTTALGPVLGGLILTGLGDAGWRLIFALNLPFGLLALALLRGRTQGPTIAGTGVDWPGAALASVGLALLALLLTEARAPMALWLATPLVLLAFVAWQAIAAHPMIRLGLFRSRSFALANLATLCLYFALNGVMFYLPMTALSAWGVTALEVTAAFLPISLLIGVLSAPAGRWADRVGPGPLMAAGAGLVAAAYAGLWLVAGTGDFWGRVVPLMGLAGLGLGLAVAPLTAAVMQGANEGEQGAASGINNAVARVAGLIAVALLGRLAAAEYGAGAPGFGLSGDDPAHLAATARGFAAVALVSAAMAGLAAVLALGVGRRVR